MGRNAARVGRVGSAPPPTPPPLFTRGHSAPGLRQRRVCVASIRTACATVCLRSLVSALAAAPRSRARRPVGARRKANGGAQEKPQWRDHRAWDALAPTVKRATVIGNAFSGTRTSGRGLGAWGEGADLPSVVRATL